MRDFTHNFGSFNTKHTHTHTLLAQTVGNANHSLAQTTMVGNCLSYLNLVNYVQHLHSPAAQMHAVQKCASIAPPFATLSHKYNAFIYS